MKYLIFPIALFISLNAVAQLSDAKQKEFDSYFESWNAVGHLGGVLGVLKDGEILYTKAY